LSMMMSVVCYADVCDVWRRSIDREAASSTR